MGAVWFIAKGDLRRRRWSAVVLTVLVGVVGGVVLASAAGARRSSSSLRRFEDATHTASVELQSGETSRAELADELVELRRVPGVAQVGVLRQLALFNDDVGFLPTAAPIDHHWGRTIDRPVVTRGRLARGAHELDIGEALATRLGLDVGDRLRFYSFTPQDIVDQEGTDTFDPNGPTVTFDIVGIVRRPLDLGARGKTGGVIVPTRAFEAKYSDEIGSFGGFVLRIRTEHGKADAPRVLAAARRIFGTARDFGVEGLGIEGEGARSAVHVTGAGLWILVVVTAVAGLVAIGLALARRMTDEVDDQDVLRALGFGRQQRWAATAMQALPVALVGGGIAVLLAWLASPLFPIGVARDAEPHPGLDFDAAVLGLGFVAVVVTVVLIGCVVAALITAKPASATERPSALSRAAGDASGAPPLVVGLGFALGRGRRRAVPAWTAIVATTIGVLGVVGAVVVFASLDRLATTPSRYGWTWGVVLDGYGGADVCPASDPIAEDPAIDAVASYCYQNLTVAGRPTIGFTLRDIRGGIRPVAVEGRLPRNAGEVALGRDVLNDVGRSIGDQVVLRGAGDADRGNHRFTVVGTTLSPGLGDAQSLAGGALFTFAGLQRAALLDPTNDYMVATLDPAHDGPAARRRLEQRNGGLPLLHATVPAEIDRLRQIDGLPLVIAAVMALVGTVAVAYTLVVSVRRRRRDLAVLKTMGFTRRQVRETVAWQATVLCGVGVLAGIALGLLAGKFMWRAIANDLGVSTAIAVPVLAIAVLVPLALVLANLVAAVPGGTAARTPPAVVLRTE